MKYLPPKGARGGGTSGGCMGRLLWSGIPSRPSPASGRGVGGEGLFTAEGAAGIATKRRKSHKVGASFYRRGHRGRGG